MTADTLKAPVKGERPSASWGGAVVEGLKVNTPTGGRGMVVSQDPSGTAISANRPWPEVRKLLPFPNGDRWAFGIRMYLEDGDGGALMVKIFNLIVRMGQTFVTTSELSIELTNTAFTGKLYLLFDWSKYPESSLQTPWSLVLAAPTLTATQELIPLYEFAGGIWTIDWIHGAHTGQGWMPEHWVGEAP